ncbi:hypothetical protein CFK40_10555 [Virgibacillus necropolis]|uniref:Uncharacterized protein n=1 Tax=Virgibacillus necropolis TaxID=163877 RepID=A0A221MCW8_9BACI|nr:hypothetical protein CFK40_10555 [Virgibacillus necropolis]
MIKTFVLLLIVLGINTLRYGTYLLEGSTSIYYLILFALNLFALIIVVISKTKMKTKQLIRRVIK